MANKPQIKYLANFHYEGKPVAPACIYKAIHDKNFGQLGSDPCQKDETQCDENDEDRVFGYYIPIVDSPGKKASRVAASYKYIGQIHFQNLPSYSYAVLLFQGSLEVFDLKGQDWLGHIDRIYQVYALDGYIIDAEIEDDNLTCRYELPLSHLYDEPTYFEDLLVLPPNLEKLHFCVTYTNEDLKKVEFDKDVLKSLVPYKDDICTTKFLIENTLDAGTFYFDGLEFKVLITKVYEKCRAIDKLERNPASMCMQ